MQTPCARAGRQRQETHPARSPGPSGRAKHNTPNTENSRPCGEVGEREAQIWGRTIWSTQRETQKPAGGSVPRSAPLSDGSWHPPVHISLGQDRNTTEAAPRKLKKKSSQMNPQRLRTRDELLGAGRAHNPEAAGALCALPRPRLQ